MENIEIMLVDMERDMVTTQTDIGVQFTWDLNKEELPKRISKLFETMKIDTIVNNKVIIYRNK